MVRGVPALGVGLLAGWLAIVGLLDVDLAPAGFQSRLVEYSVGLLWLLVLAAGAAFVWSGLRWVLLGLWPGPVGVAADKAELRLQFGPYGDRTYDAARLTIRYLFELDEEEQEGMVEALMPEDFQRANYVPRIRHPEAPEPLEARMRRLLRRDETAIAAALRPMIDLWHPPAPE